VVSEGIYRIAAAHGPVYMQDFEIEAPAGRNVDAAAAAPRFKECFARVLAGEADNDGFNALVVGAGLDWREAALLRAYCRYALQTNLRFSQAYIQEVLGRFPQFCRALVDRFRATFDPALAARERTAALDAADALIAAELERTSSLDDDRILRMFSGAI